MTTSYTFLVLFFDLAYHIAIVSLLALHDRETQNLMT